ncbi:MAG: Rne/Rng family ribonuclease [Elusimicrobiota bacterium]
MVEVKKKILVSTVMDETRVAVFENDKLVEFYIDNETTRGFVGNIYKGKVVNVLVSLQSAFINIGVGKNVYLSSNDTVDTVTGFFGQKKRITSHRIENRMPKNKEVVVQVTKDPISEKGAKVSEKISLPGRYVVYMPTEERNVYVSQRIMNNAERKRLKEIVEPILPDCGTIIIRTEGEGQGLKDFKDDLRYLTRVWKTIQARAGNAPAPSVLYKNVDIVLQVLRDTPSSQIENVLVDDDKQYENVIDYVSHFDDELKGRVRLYNEHKPLFEMFEVNKEIAALANPYVKLKSGGYLIIQQTESLCAIDVNSGSSRGKGTGLPEDTALVTNIEAAEEIARQIRLRNHGGIIVIDFIDLRKRENRNTVYHKLENALKNDKAKLDILPFNSLGLIEIARQRKRESNTSMVTEECRHCSGAGRVLSKSEMFTKVMEDIVNVVRRRGHGVKVEITVALDLFEYFKSRLPELEKYTKAEVKIMNEPAIVWHDYRIMIN